MATPLALIFDLIAHDNASAGFRKVGAAAKATAAETETMGTKFAKAGTLIGVAAVGVAAVSAKMAISFQESTEKIVTGAGESEDAIGEVRKGILKMAGSVGTMPEELSKGMYLIESAGFRGAKGLDVLHAAAEGAKVGGAQMATVADGLTTAMKDYNLPTSRAAEITSKLVATVAAGKTNMEDLSGSMAKVLPFSANLGISFKETMGAMATMTGEGIQAANAATMLKFTMMSLSNETPKGSKALEDVGLSAQKVTSSLGSKGLNATLTMVIDAIGKKFPKGSADYNKALASVVGGTRGMGATLAITGSHAKTFSDNVKTIGSSSADANGHVKNFALTQKDLAFQEDQAKAALSAFAIELGTEMLPKITTAIKFFTEHKTVTKDLGIAVLAVAGFLVTYSIATKVATAATGVYALAQKVLGTNMAATAVATEGATAAQADLDVAMDANPIGAVAVAVGVLAAAYLHFRPHADSAKDAEKKFAASIGDVTDLLNSQTGALKRSAAASISKKLADSGAYEAARKMGISMKDVLHAAEGNTEAMKRVKYTEDQYSASLYDTDAHRKLAAANIKTLTGAVGGYTMKISKARQAMVDEAEASGHLSRALSAIKAPQVDLDTSAFTASLRYVIASMNKIGSLSATAKADLHASGVGHNAKGTDNWGGGLTWVGEEGPELINLAKGAQVIPNDKATAMGGGHGHAGPSASLRDLRKLFHGLAITVDGKPARLSIAGA